MNREFKLLKQVSVKDLSEELINQFLKNPDIDAVRLEYTREGKTIRIVHREVATDFCTGALYVVNNDVSKRLSSSIDEYNRYLNKSLEKSNFKRTLSSLIETARIRGFSQSIIDRLNKLSKDSELSQLSQSSKDNRFDILFMTNRNFRNYFGFGKRIILPESVSKLSSDDECQYAENVRSFKRLFLERRIASSKYLDCFDKEGNVVDKYLLQYPNVYKQLSYVPISICPRQNEDKSSDSEVDEQGDSASKCSATTYSASEITSENESGVTYTGKFNYTPGGLKPLCDEKNSVQVSTNDQFVTRKDLEAFKVEVQKLLKQRSNRKISRDPNRQSNYRKGGGVH